MHSCSDSDAKLFVRLGDIINKWRQKLDLEPIGLTDGPNLASTLKIPFTYCWSPALVPKPMDWPSHIGTLKLLLTLRINKVDQS